MISIRIFKLSKDFMVIRSGLEPLTYGLEGVCSHPPKSAHFSNENDCLATVKLSTSQNTITPIYTSINHFYGGITGERFSLRFLSKYLWQEGVGYVALLSGGSDKTVSHNLMTHDMSFCHKKTASPTLIEEAFEPFVCLGRQQTHLQIPNQERNQTKNYQAACSEPNLTEHMWLGLQVAG